MRIYNLKKIFIRFCPPIFLELLIFLKNCCNNKQNSVVYHQKIKPSKVNFLKINYDFSDGVFNLPISKIKHPGGQGHNAQQHHFIAYFQHGVSALQQFYSTHQPTSIYEKHFIYNYSGLQLSVPWMTECKTMAKGEHGLGFEHGHSSCGPISEEKLKLEISRLDHCLNSLRQKGYVVFQSFPKQENGYPRGYFLISRSGNWIFRLVGGKHRVAAMAWLGWENIPVKCEPRFPKCIYEDDIKNWPRVASGEFSLVEAKMIFDAYFRSDSKKIW
jgi:hypothetical protein